MDFTGVLELEEGTLRPLWGGVLCFAHHETPRMHKQPTCHLEGYWEHLGASCGLSGALYGLVGASRALMHGSLLAFEMLWGK